MSKTEFILSRIDEATVREFTNAWKSVGAGTDSIEAVILLFRNVDGFLRARSLPLANQSRRFEFQWNQTIVGVVHTHPNSCGSRPTAEDKQLADKFGVPVITLTYNGMYLYDPDTKKVGLVLPNVEWLEPFKLNNGDRLLAHSVTMGGYQH
jgi:hypothetical protein